MIESKDLYWAAGFLEGEGCFRYATRSGATACVEASQVQKEPLDRILAMFGGYLRLRQRGVKEGSQPIWRYIATGRRAVGIMMTLYPIMSPRRKRQILQSLDEWKSRKARPGRKWKGRDC